MSILSPLSLRFQVGPKEWQRWQFALVSRVPRGKMGKAPAKLPLSVLQRASVQPELAAVALQNSTLPAKSKRYRLC